MPFVMETDETKSSLIKKTIQTSNNDSGDKLTLPNESNTSSTTLKFDPESVDNISGVAKTGHTDVTKEPTSPLINKNSKSKEDSEKVEINSPVSNNPQVDRSQYVHYEGDTAIYTDPQSRQQYTWNKEKNEWTLRQINYEFDGTNYFHTDKSGSKLKWDTSSNSWIKQSTVSVPLVPSENLVDSSDEEEYDENNARKTAPPVQRQDMSKGSYGYEGETHTYTDATDGTVYLWDKEKNAWFPKVDDDFLARYQMSYGFVDPSSSETDKQAIGDKDKVENKVENLAASPENNEDKCTQDKVLSAQKRKIEPPKWFDIGQESTKVYVSNLPLDLSQEEFVDLMQKCGLVMKELDTNQMKVKLYTDPYTKQFKGDALCTYIKRESVDLALNILDGHEVRGKKIKVEKAKFTMKGEAYDPKLKPKKKRKKDLEKLKKAQEKLFDWRPDKMRGERGKNESVIVVKNLFDPAMFDKEVTLILEYQQDMRDECSKCGHVKKVVIHDKHPEGVAQIFFKEADAADACKALLSGRWFGQRQITAETWDGKTRYKVQETPEEREARLKKWEVFLQDVERNKKEIKTGETSITEESIVRKSISKSVDKADDESKESRDSVSKDERESSTDKSDEMQAAASEDGDSDATRSSGDSGGED